MEHHRKQQSDQKAHERGQKQKHAFFREVFQECEAKLSSKEFEFFVKCIIPHRALHNRTSSNPRKPQNSTLMQERETNINDINPHVLTMPRKVNFYEEKSIDKINLERVNRRILTTPTEKVKRQIKFNNYQDYELYKKMKSYQETMTKTSGQSKMYAPEPLFYPPTRKQVPKVAWKVNAHRSKQKSKRQHWRIENLSEDKNNTEFIPDYFIELLKSSHNFKTLRHSKTGYLKSMR